jgi:hypothetical protein
MALTGTGKKKKQRNTNKQNYAMVAPQGTDERVGRWICKSGKVCDYKRQTWDWGGGGLMAK